MTDCRKYSSMLSSFVDGELSEAESTKLAFHLKECASCQSLLTFYENISRSVGETLVEPPEDFAQKVMQKITNLPQNDSQTGGLVTKTKRTMKPIVLTFVAAAACLALVFIVSPELFSISSGTDTVASVPMASVMDDSGTLGASLDEETEQNSLKAATGCETTDPAGSENGAVTEERMDITAASDSTPTPDANGQIYSASGNGSGSNVAIEYYAVFIIEDQLPDILKDEPMTAEGDGTFKIEISVETAKALLKAGNTAAVENEKAEKALVIFTPVSN